MAIFPSREWVEAVLEAAKNSEEYKRAAKDWEGDFLCVIEGDEEFLSELGRREVLEGFLSFLDMMPAEARKKYRGTPLGDTLEQKLGVALDASFKELDVNRISDALSKLSWEEFEGGALYCWTDFWHGTIRHMTGVAPGEHEDATFTLTGPYSNWKLLLSGKEDAVKLTMTNKLRLEGDLMYMMARVRAVMALSKEVFGGVPLD